MTQPVNSHGFLAGLTRLPLIGGSVAIIGNPTGVDVEPTQVMLESYSAWLNFELRHLNAGLLPRGRDGGVSFAIPMDNDGARFHARSSTCPDPFTDVRKRAALVLAAAGCTWNGSPTFG